MSDELIDNSSPSCQGQSGENRAEKFIDIIKYQNRIKALIKKTLRNIPVGIFLIAWVLPLLYFGMRNSGPPWLPHFIAQRVNISRLFAIEHKTLAVFEIQFRRENSSIFETLDEKQFFRMRPFGYRTRMQRALALGSRSQRFELVEWLKTGMESGAHDDQIAEMKILVFPYEIDEKHLVKGRYHQPNSSQINENAVSVLGRYDFTNAVGSH